MNEYLQQLEDEELSLLETLDHVLSAGLVIAGEITISIADIDLIFLGLNVLIGSVDTIEDVLGKRKKAARPASESPVPPVAGE
jgi:hypothetical protein